MLKREIQSYVLGGCPVQQSEDSSSSDINLFRQVSILVSDLEGESEAIGLRIGVSSCGTLAMERGLGQNPFPYDTCWPELVRLLSKRFRHKKQPKLRTRTKHWTTLVT